jgi:hypothetical protein
MHGEKHESTTFQEFPSTRRSMHGEHHTNLSFGEVCISKRSRIVGRRSL